MHPTFKTPFIIIFVKFWTNCLTSPGFGFLISFSHLIMKLKLDGKYKAFAQFLP